MSIDYIGFYSKHVENLKKAGSQYQGACPICKDSKKGKNFSLNSDNGLWYCFNPKCIPGGNAITFCQKMNIPVENAPDYAPGYQRYSYGGGISKMKPGKGLKNQGKSEWWDGTEGKGLPDDMKPYNHQAIDQARELRKTLWICEGEKDAVTMTEAGELAAAVPSASMTKVFNGVSLDDIPEVIIVCDNDDAGSTATEKLKDMFPFAKVVIWPSMFPRGYDVTDVNEELEGKELAEGLRQYVKSDTWFDMADMTDSFLLRTKQGTAFIKTGFDKLDSLIGGLLPGGLHVIQGSSSIGKTTFCKQLADQVKEENSKLPIFFFALEDSLHTMQSMTYSRLSFLRSTDERIENQLIQKGGNELTSAQYDILQELTHKVKVIGKENYLVAGEPDINVRTIRDRVEKKLHRLGKSTALVIVDYLQILPTPKEERLGSLMDRIDFNLHELQCFARDINGPVILTSSTTKGDIKETEKSEEPGLVKGKGSANILFTPRRLFELLERKPELGSDQEYMNMELHVLKNSVGPKTKQDEPIKFFYRYKYSFFSQPPLLGAV